MSEKTDHEPTIPISPTLVKKFHDACDVVIRTAKGKPSNNILQYAASYALQGKRMDSYDQIADQALYILDNCKYWRGALAESTKETLKEFLHDNK